MNRHIICLLLIFYANPLFSESPWGKDADISFPQSPAQQNDCSQSLLARIGESAIRFHQEVISPADGPRSHFIPSSSQYTLDAMRKYGFFKGFSMGCDRLMRENDAEWVYRKTVDGSGRQMKWDPVK